MKTTGSAEQNDPKAEKARLVPSAQQRPAPQDSFMAADVRLVPCRLYFRVRMSGPDICSRA